MGRRKEFLQVQKMIVKLSRREFNGLTQLTGGSEMLDALIENLVMLGEELNESTVSQEYFQDIFNSVPEIILIMNYKGEILTGNNAMTDLLHTYKAANAIPGHFNNYFENTSRKNPFNFLRESIKRTGQKATLKVRLKSSPEKIFNCTMGRLQSEHKSIKYLVLIKDVTELENYQEMLIDSAMKYRQIFSSSSDGIFIFCKKGNITEKNEAFNQLLKQEEGAFKENNVYKLILPAASAHSKLADTISSNSPITNMEVKVKASDGTFTDCLFSCTAVYEKSVVIAYQGMLKNISGFKEYNTWLMRAMGEFQESERKRIATDLHDSLGQQLSGIKFMISSMASVSSDQKQKSLLVQMNADIFHIIEDLRKICFDLMPGTLEKFGLIKTIEELIGKLKRISPGVSISFRHRGVGKNPGMDAEVNIYRIIQEFINNSLKHSGCKKIKISLLTNQHELILTLKDDGKGFNTRLLTEGKGMGVSNIVSRARSFNGTATIQSKLNYGTTFTIKIPLKHEPN